MENYYIPEIEEFYIGFECEYNSGISINTEPSKWVKEITNQDLLNIIFDSWEHPDYEDEFKDSFRVKYLDKDDIESLGFINTTPEDETMYLHGYTEMFHNGYFRLFVNYITHKIKITLPLSDGETLFIGIIKNLSELKTLLKWLRILE